VIAATRKDGQKMAMMRCAFPQPAAVFAPDTEEVDVGMAESLVKVYMRCRHRYGIIGYIPERNKPLWKFSTC
jgi:hypothetical protein